jgi:ABC-type sugar transport system substrate-binding protein
MTMLPAIVRSAFGMALLAAGLLRGETGGEVGRLPSTSFASPIDSTLLVFPTRLDGTYWARLTPAEKRIYLQGFVAGAAAEQAKAAGVPAESLRDRHALHFAFMPPVYAAQVDDFYWWQNHATTPIVEAMQQINGTR